MDVIKFIELVHVRHFDSVLRKRFLQRLYSDAYEEEILRYLILLGCPSHIFSLKNQLQWLFKFALCLADGDDFPRRNDTEEMFFFYS